MTAEALAGIVRHPSWCTAENVPGPVLPEWQYEALAEAEQVHRGRVYHVDHFDTAIGVALVQPYETDPRGALVVSEQVVELVVENLAVEGHIATGWLSRTRPSCGQAPADCAGREDAEPAGDPLGRALIPLRDRSPRSRLHSSRPDPRRRARAARVAVDSLPPGPASRASWARGTWIGRSRVS